jgi:hypothetical protein
MNLIEMKRLLLIKIQVAIWFFLIISAGLYSQPFTDSGISLTGIRDGSLSWGDYDNDGDLDFVVCGDSAYNKISRIFRNNGSGVFTPQYQIKLTGVMYSSISWGDYDIDGDLDLLLCGFDENYKKISKIYRNDAATFTDINAPLTGVGFSCSSAWGDFDNDGDLDVIITGSARTNYVSKIYSNNGNETFSEELSVSIPGVQNGSVSWGDYNNDSYIDLILTGTDNSSNEITRLFTNNGDKTFTEDTNSAFPGVTKSNVAWGDYDNDGDLDILLSGWLGSNLGSISRIYNNNNGIFTDINAGLTGLSGSSVAWGDYDNDGDLDILLAGSPGSGSVTIIYRNDNGVFTDISATLPTSVSAGCAAWGDYDNDGDLDILFSGYSSPDRFTRIYRNDGTIQNSKPETPSGLSTVNNDGVISLKWDKTTDNQTPQDGLNYNIYIYESGQTNYKYPPHAFRQSHALNGRRLVSRIGNIQWSSSGYKVKNLPPLKTYYWSVQAVDAGLSGSSFSAENSFTIPVYRPSVQSAYLSFSDIEVNQVLATWSIGGGASRAVFIKADGEENADPEDNTTYYVNSLTQGGWKCVYNGTSNSATISGLTPGINYTVHVCEYNGAPGDEKYLLTNVFQNPSVINTVFTENNGINLPSGNQSSILWGDYDNDNDLDIFFSGTWPTLAYNGTLFTDFNELFYPGISSMIGSAAWGDYDNDGDLDIIMSGNLYKEGASILYANNGDKTFINQNIGLPGLVGTALAWGDYNNDGFLDFVLTGAGSLKYAGIFKNNGNNTFSAQTGITLKGVDRSAVAWGDYDNDNNLDLILSGRDDNSNRISRLYRNNGNNSFTEQSQVEIKGLEYCSVAWGDYDNDGYLDILMTGMEASGNNTSVIYRNNGNGLFAEQSDIVLTGVYYGSGSWGDYDNDGDLDILLVGRNNEGLLISRIFENNGNNIFSERSGINLTGIYRGSGTWADCDNDSDLDILISGQDVSGTEITKLYINNKVEINNIPATPVNLGYCVMPNSRILFNWNRVKTDETSPKSLSYNIKIGRTSGATNFLSPQSSSGGYRLVPEMGNAQLDTSFLFTYCWDSLYYASVQAIDNSFKGGAFSNEIQVKITPQQPSDLTGINKTPTSILLKWKRGNGSRCILFAMEGTTGTASPDNYTTYYGNSVFGEGSPIGTTGWYCIYKGESDTVFLTGLDPSKNYRIHAIELQGSSGSEVYASIPSTTNIGTFSTALFTQQQISGLTDVGASSVKWGDYDNDGDLDILLTGGYIFETIGLVPVTNAGLFTNNGDNTFTKLALFDSPHVHSGSNSWIDYDNDGYLDILISGEEDPVRVTKLFRNNNGIDFSEQAQILFPQVCFSFMAWADYDNDDDLDLLLTGATSLTTSRDPVSKLYRNNGNGIFEEQWWVPLPQVYHSAVDWGDYDKDGYPDILLTGATGYYNDYQPVSKVYRNNRDSTFTEMTEIELLGFYAGSAKWIDFDNDSDLDIFLCGATSSVYSDPQPVSKIYINNNDGTFTEREDINLTGVYNSSSSWGDYDSDGDPDLLISGNIFPNSCYSAIYRNDGDIGFTEMKDFSLLSLRSGSAEWADYDNDGDLDFLLAGFDASNNPFTRIYKNNAIMTAASIPPNRKPASPLLLESEITPNNVKLSWSPVLNDETPYKAMSYNIRWRMKNDTIWYLAAQSNTSGFRRVVNLGNIQLNKSYDLKNWPAGDWEWQVQAIDQGYMGGAWSEIETFIVKNTQAFFETDIVCQGLPTHFTDQSVATEGVASWKWDFNDGTTSSQQDPVHYYSAGGTYSVKLVITSTAGDKDSLTQNVVVKPRPVVSFSVPNVCEGLTAQITNLTNANGTIISGWNWDFGDEQISIVQNPVTHYYTDRGTYSIKLKATATNGCADSLVKQLVIATYPNAAVSINGKATFCQGDSVVLSADYNSLYGYQWMLDNNDLVDGLVSNYTVKSNSGLYSVRITNPQANCVSTSSQTIVTINPAPVAPYISISGLTEFCQGDSVILSVTNTPGYTYEWKKDGGAVGLNSSKYTANQSGIYNVTVTNANNCSVNSTNSVNIKVNDSPSAGNISLSGQPAFCEGGSVTLSVPQTAGYIYNWRNESGLITGATSNSYTATTTGTYELEITNTSGCTARTSPVSITVNKSPVKPVLVPANYTEGECPGLDPVRLNADQAVAGYHYLWYKDGLPRLKDTLSYLDLYEKGLYKLEADMIGCKVESDIFTVDFPDAPSKPLLYVRGPVVWYMASSNNKASYYRWYRNDELISGANKNIYVANKTLGTYKVAIGNESECYTFSDEVTIPVTKSEMTYFNIPAEYLIGEDDNSLGDIRIYPSPTTGLFTIEMDNDILGELNIEIITEQGKAIRNIRSEKVAEHYRTEIDLSSQPKGVYFIKLKIDEYFATKKVIIE